MTDMSCAAGPGILASGDQYRSGLSPRSAADVVGIGILVPLSSAIDIDDEQRNLQSEIAQRLL
jgi:hypothetical protein